MNILFVSALLPYPLHSGGQVRIYNILKRLSKRHTITLVSFIREEFEKTYIKDLSFCKKVFVVNRGRARRVPYLVKAAFSSYPWLLATYDHAHMRDLISGLISEGSFDLIHAEPFYVWPSLPASSLPLIITEHNIEHEVYGAYADGANKLLQSLMRWDIRKLVTWEKEIWNKADSLIAVSEHDSAVMRSHTITPVTIVPNGVDLSTFSFRKRMQKDEKTILFVGNFRWVPNRDAATSLVRAIWPGVRNSHKKARLLIVGRNMPEALKNEVIAAGGEARDDVNNIMSVYERADFLVAPHTIAGGTKFKLLEAMAVGLLVITTRAGATGIDVTPNIHYRQANDTDEFVTTINSMWNNWEEAERMSKAARHLIEKKYDWDIIVAGLEKVWKNLIFRS